MESNRPSGLQPVSQKLLSNELIIPTQRSTAEEEPGSSRFSGSRCQVLLAVTPEKVGEVSLGGITMNVYLLGRGRV